MIDDYYKLKLINKITSEKQDYIDALGEYFNKKYIFLFYKNYLYLYPRFI